MSRLTTTTPNNESRPTETPDQSGLQSDSGFHTYFAAMRGVVKIGKSRNPLQRMTLVAKAQSGDVRPCGSGVLTVLLVLTEDIEKELHRRFAADRLIGEWFRHGTAITQYVEANKHRDIWTHERQIHP